MTEVDNLTNVLFMHGSVNCTVYIIHAHTVNVLQKSFLVFTEPTCIVTIRSSLQGDLKRILGANSTILLLELKLWPQYSLGVATASWKVYHV